MSIPRWAETADDSPALITATRTWTRRDVLAEVSARIEPWRGVSRITIVGAASADRVLDLLAAIEARVPALMIHPRWTRLETDVITARFERASIPEGALAIVATSGTSGAPKLAVLSRRAFAASAHASAMHLGHDASDRWLLAMPLAHVGGLGVVVRSIVYGTPIVLHEGGGDPSSWLPLAREARVTHVSLVPTTLARLLDAPDPVPASVRVALVGGAACPERLHARALAKGVPVHRTYGLTETCGQVATSSSDGLELLPDVEAKIVDGTIRVRSPAAMDGWLDAESPFDDEGFYDTGDLGELEGRTLTVHARRTDLIVSGGENVYPREVEDALEQLDGVHAACVFGESDDVWGQRVVAAIVANATSDDDIVRALRERLAGFKVPRRIVRLDALVLNGAGKVDRAATAALARRNEKGQP